MKGHVKVAGSDTGSKLRAVAAQRPKRSACSAKSASQVFRSFAEWERHYLPNGLTELPPIFQL